MNMISSKNLARTALAVVVAGLALTPGATGSQRVESVRGVCNFEGTRYLDSYSFLSAREKTVSQGTCFGSVNGGPLDDHEVKLVTVSSLPLIDIRSRGRGWIKVAGLTDLLRFRFERNAGRVLLLSGAAGSRAVAALNRSGADRDRHTLVLEATSRLRGR